MSRAMTTPWPGPGFPAQAGVRMSPTAGEPSAGALHRLAAGIDLDSAAFVRSRLFPFEERGFCILTCNPSTV